LIGAFGPLVPEAAQDAKIAQVNMTTTKAAHVGIYEARRLGDNVEI